MQNVPRQPVSVVVVAHDAVDGGGRGGGAGLVDAVGGGGEGAVGDQVLHLGLGGVSGRIILTVLFK